MRPIGFSTGPLAKSDFVRGIQLQVERPDIAAIELSALRDHELRPLIEALPRLEIDGFAYVSLHAPSRLGNLSEDRKSTRLNSSHTVISYAVFCLKKKKDRSNYP